MPKSKMATRHERLFGTSASHPAQYAAVAVVGCILLQITACILTKRRARRMFDTWSVLTVALVCAFTFVVRGAYFPRQMISTVCVCAWSVRLAVYLYRRQLVSDTVGVQDVLPRILWTFTCSLPVVLVNEIQIHAYHITLAECLGCLLCLTSLTFQTVADAQKQAWHTLHRATRPAKSADEPPVCHTGLWAWSRHPNMFGELIFHWSVYLIVQPVLPASAALAPAANTLMLLLGGFKKVERQRNGLYALYPQYALYKHRTSPLIPTPPRIYGRLSSVFKLRCCCEVQELDF
jgi:steroid 5-alpha reductase family enzyme